MPKLNVLFVTEHLKPDSKAKLTEQAKTPFTVDLGASDGQDTVEVQAVISEQPFTKQLELYANSIVFMGFEGNSIDSFINTLKSMQFHLGRLFLKKPSFYLVMVGTNSLELSQEIDVELQKHYPAISVMKLSLTDPNNGLGTLVSRVLRYQLHNKLKMAPPVSLASPSSMAASSSNAAAPRNLTTDTGMRAAPSNSRVSALPPAYENDFPPPYLAPR